MPNTSVYGTVFKFENENSDRSRRHNQWGAHIWTPELEKLYGAKKGDPFEGQDGKTYHTAAYDNLNIGDKASRHVIDKVWNASGQNPERFAEIYTGHESGHPTVKNIAGEIARRNSEALKEQDSQTKVGRLINSNSTSVENTLQKEREQNHINQQQEIIATSLPDLIRKYPEAVSLIKSMAKDGVHDAAVVERSARIEAEKKTKSVKPKGTLEKAWIKASRSNQSLITDILWYRHLTGISGMSTEDIIELTQKLEQKSAEDPIEAEGWVEEVLLPFAGFSPSLYKSLEQSILGGAAGAAPVLAFGLVATPGIPDELATVPIAAGMGASAATTMYWYQQGTGSIYRNLIMRGVDPNTAGVAAAIGGAPYAFIERLQMKGFVPLSLKNELAEVLANSTGDALKSLAGKYGLRYASEIGQEGLQELNNIVWEEGAVWLDNKLRNGEIDQATYDEMKERITETLIESAKAFVIPVGVGGAIDVGVVASKGKAATQAEEQVLEQVGKDQLSPSKAQLKKISVPVDEKITKEEESEIIEGIEEEEKPKRKPKKEALAEIDDALEAGEATPGVAALAKNLVEQDPDFDIRTNLHISQDVIELTDDFIRDVVGKEPEEFYKDEGLVYEEAEEVEALGVTRALEVQGEIQKTAIKLYKGHDADTLVEEFYHSSWFHMDEKDKKEYKKYYDKIIKETSEQRSIEELFAQEGRDYFFSEGMHKKASGLRGVFDWDPNEKIESKRKQIKKVLSDLIDRIRRIRGAKIPKKILALYKKAGERKLPKLTKKQKALLKLKEKSIDKNIQFQVRKKPKKGLFTSWDNLTDKEVGDSNAMRMYQKFQDYAEIGTYPMDPKFVMIGNLGMLDLRNDSKDNTVYLSAIASFERGAGKGTQLLKMTLEIADELELVLTGSVKQFGVKGLNDEQLLAWYKRHGFDAEQYGDRWTITYTPKSLKEKSTPLTLTGKFGSLEKPLTLSDFKEVETDNVSTTYMYTEQGLQIEIDHRTDNGEWTVYNYINQDEEVTYSEEEALDAANAIAEDMLFDELIEEKSERGIQFQLRRKAQKQIYDILPVPEKGLDEHRKSKNRKPGVGAPKNKRKVFENDDVYIVIGSGKTTQDWIKQVEKVLSKKEITEAADWYEKIYDVFVNEFKDEDKAIKYMTAWLVAQKQATPSESLANVFRAAQQEVTGMQKDSKKAGLSDTEVRKILRDEVVEGGIGPKLYDFVDAAIGSDTRRFVGNAKDGGQPFVVDRHTFRDIGYVDPPFYNMLERRFGKKRARYITQDGNQAGQVNTSQYTAGSKWGNNVTKELNEMQWNGRSDWEAREIQAIGWIAMEKMIGEVSDVELAFTENTFNIAHELVFGEGSAYSKKFDFSKLNDQQIKNVTEKVLSRVIEIAAEVTGVRVKDKSVGFGGWMDSIQPNYVTEIQANNPGASRMMDVIGYLTQQTEIFATKTENRGRQLGVDFIAETFEDETIAADFYSTMRKAHPDKVYGYYPVNTKHGKGVRMVFDMHVPKSVKLEDIGNRMEPMFKELIDGLNNTIAAFEEKNNIVVNDAPIRVISKSNGNDYKKKTKGQDYRQRITRSLGPKVQRRLDNTFGPEIETLIEESIAEESTQVAFQLRPKRLSQEKTPKKQAAGYKTVDEKGDAIPNLELDEETTFRWLQRKLQDKLNRLEHIQEKIGEHFEISEEMDAYLASTLYIGKTKERMDKFENEILDKGGLFDRIVSAGYTLEQFGEYLQARHAKERNEHIAEINDKYPDGGSGMDTADAAEILKGYRGDKQIREFAQEFYRRVTKRALRVRLNAGLITRKDFDTLSKYYKNYVPLFVDRIEDLENKVSTGKGFSVPFVSELKRARGSKKKRVNPAISAVMEMMSIIQKSEKNKVGLKFLELVESVESESWTVRKQKFIPVFNEWGEIRFLKPELDVKDNQFGVRVDGKLHIIEIHDEALARAMKNLGTEKTWKYLTKANNYLRAILTTYNPEFPITNFSRDIQTALIHVEGEYKGMGLEVIKNVVPAGFGVWGNIRNNKDKEWANLYQELKDLGGKVGWFDVDSIEDYKKKVETSLLEHQKGLRSSRVVAKKIGKFVNDANEAVESSVRLATYKALIDRGVSKKKAAAVAKGITVDFNKKGEWGTWANTLWLFWNATVQSGARIGFSIAKHKRTRRIVYSLVGMNFAISMLNYLVDPEEWEKMNTWEKDNYLIFMIGGGQAIKPVKVPYGYNIFHVAGKAAADVVMGTNDIGQAGSRMLKAINDAVSPFGDGSAAQVISPTIGDPWVQLWENEDFKSTKIYKERYNTPTTETPNFKMYWEESPPSWISRWVTEGLSTITGGTREKGIKRDKEGNPKDHYIPGKIDINPDVLDYIVGWFTGGLGKFTGRLFNTGANLIKGEPTDWKNVPFVRQWYSPPDKRGLTELSYIRKMMKRSAWDVYDHVQVSKFKKYVIDADKLGVLKESQSKLVKDQWGELVPKVIRDFNNNQRLAKGLPKINYKKGRRSGRRVVP